MIQTSISIFVYWKWRPKWTPISSSKYIIHMEVAKKKPSTWNIPTHTKATVTFHFTLFADLSGAHYISLRGLLGNVVPKLLFRILSKRRGGAGKGGGDNVMDLLHGKKKKSVPLWPQGGTMVTKNAQPPNRVTITRGFYVIVTINSCYYYHYGISKDQQITLVFGEKIKCFFLKKKFFFFCLQNH